VKVYEDSAKYSKHILQENCAEANGLPAIQIVVLKLLSVLWFDYIVMCVTVPIYQFYFSYYNRKPMPHALSIES
jgi:hypothetical protein